MKVTWSRWTHKDATRLYSLLQHKVIPYLAATERCYIQWYSLRICILLSIVIAAIAVPLLLTQKYCPLSLLLVGMCICTGIAFLMFPILYRPQVLKSYATQTTEYRIIDKLKCTAEHLADCFDVIQQSTSLKQKADQEHLQIPEGSGVLDLRRMDTEITRTIQKLSCFSTPDEVTKLLQPILAYK